MSGQPRLNPTDGAKFRQEYLANLALQMQNDDTNLQANKIFKKTGQTPSQPMDTRSTTEKLADIERLKIDVRAGLAEIADGQQAQDIVNHLAGDADALRFVAQYMPEIIKDLKPKYKYGILSAVFIPYIMRYMEKFNQTQGVEFGLQQATGQEILMTNQQILRDMVQQGDLLFVIDTINRHTRESGINLSNATTQAIKRNIAELQDVILTEADLAHIDGITDPILKMRLRTEISEAMRELPSKGEIMDLMRQLEVAIKRNDPVRAEAVGAQIVDMTTTPPSTIQLMQAVKAEAMPEKGLASGGEPTDADLWFNVISPERQQQGITASADVYTHFFKDLHDSGTLTFPGIKKFSKGKPIKRDLIEFSQRPDTVAFLNSYFGGSAGGGGGGKELSMGPGMTMGKSSPTMGQLGASEGTSKKIKIKKAEPQASEGTFSAGKGIKGKGLIKTKADNFIEFGKLLINPAKLDENIIAIRRPTGRNTPEFPTERVSKHLGKVIRHISGGGVPAFEDLSKLDEKEKRFLHKLMKSSSLIDRISVPTPNKDEDEKDTHRFEVLKGEILSGNDSQQTIKELKVLILKLVSKDLLPKSQAREILFDLVSLGH